jgi:hypothetical protein
VKVGIVEVVAGGSGEGAGASAAGGTSAEAWACCGGGSLVIDVDVVSLREVLIVVLVELSASEVAVVPTAAVVN